MSYNEELIKEKLSEITKETFQEAVFLAYRDGITSVAPLGHSGDTVMIFGTELNRRSSAISIRNYCGDAELLITDKKGSFLFYGRFRVDLGLEIVVEQYWNIFNLLKDKIETIVERNSQFKDIKIPENCERTIGFELLKLAQNG